MDTGDHGGPGPASSMAKKRRGNVGKACNNCRRRKSRCDGQQPECKTCQIYNDECSWGQVEDGRKPASRQYVNALKNRISVLETYLKEQGQQLPSPGLGESESGIINEEENEEVLDEVSTTMLHLHMGEAGEQVHYYGPTSAFAHSSHDPPISASPIDTKSGPHLNGPHDYRRYLPVDVTLSHVQHTVILDRFFRFFASWGLRAMPDLFHQDMIRTVMLPPHTPLARFTHYSPFLHNIILAIALMWSDENYLRQTDTRAVFAQKAETYLSVEIARPTLATVQGLALKSSYHSTLGDHTGGWAYFGMADRAGLSLGLNLNCTSLVDAGRMSKSEMLMRRNAFWCIFIQEQCWSVYIGRPHESQAYSTPLPTVDEQLDEMPWRWDNLDSPDSGLPPQPCMFSTAFVETAKLTAIMQRVMTTLYSIKSDAFKLQKDSTITDLGLALDSWTENLPASLVINGHSLRNALPHILMLQLAKEWCTILIYRPYYRPVAHMTGSHRAAASSESILNLAVRRCDRSAARINTLLRTYHQRFGLRYTPPTLFNIAFTAGTTHLLSAVRHHGARVKDTALADARECVDFLNSVAESWPAAGQKADILETLVREYHPQTESLPFEQSITLDRASISGGTGSRSQGESRTADSSVSLIAGLTSENINHSITMPVNIEQQPQHQSAQSDPMSLLATSNQSTGYPSLPWNFASAFQQAPPLANPTQMTPPLGMSTTSGEMSEDYNDPFLFSLLNHITLPPNVPQTATSPEDAMFMPSTAWSPPISNYQTQSASRQDRRHGPSQQSQQNPFSSQMDGNSTLLAYMNQPHVMGSTNQYQALEHEEVFSPNNRNTGVGPSVPPNNVNGPRSNMQWNGYFGSS